jgi:hypothetical protein
MSDHALSVILAVIAALYASVGQAGGTGYVAVMGLLNYGPEVIKPTALALNVLVAAIRSAFWARRSRFSAEQRICRRRCISRLSERCFSSPQCK